MSDPQKPTLLIIDGHSLAFRAFFALVQTGNFITDEGQHTEAVYGFLSMMLRLLKDEEPTHLGVAFDLSRKSFRTDEYAEYKEGRGETPPEFSGQVGLLQDALTAMNVTWITKEDYEADDILATLAAQGAQQGFRVLVVSGDRDSFQLIDDDVTVLYPSAMGVTELKRYDAQAVFDKYKVWPHQYPELAALVGEKADNLPGIDKVGPVTAAKWIAQWGTVDEILAHADEIKGVAGNNLREQRDRAERNRRLNALVRDLDLPYGPVDLARRPIDEVAVREVLGALQMRTMLDRVLKLGQTDAAATSGAIARSAAPEVRTLAADEVAAWIAAQDAPLGLAVSVEVEGGEFAGVGLSSLTASAHVPVTALDGLRDWLADVSAPKVFFGAKRQLEDAEHAGLTIRGAVHDTRVMGGILSPTRVPATLGDQVLGALEESMPVSDPNQLVPEVPALGPATEAWYVARVADAVNATLATEVNANARRVYDEIELPLIPVLAGMELDGVAIDRGVLAGQREVLEKGAETYRTAAFAAIGHEVNLGSPKQLQTVLFDELKLPPTRKTKTGYSTDADSLADLLESIEEENEGSIFLQSLLRHRDATKLKQMIETLEKSIGSDGRIHTTYDQVGAATGRMSSNDPNLQNIPVRSEEGRRIRSAFIAGEGFESLLTADYSQIEMRIMAHLSGDAGLIEAFREGEDLHRYVGSHVFGVAPGDVTPAMRNKVKAMSYGLAYGLGPFGLAKQLRITQAEARQLMTDYFERFGRVRDYLRDVVQQAKSDGYTETIFGRRRPFPDLNSPNRVLRDNAERAALNSPIQGSAADIMKIAMLGVAADMAQARLGSRMLLQVHDELIFEVAPGERKQLEEIVTRRMSTAATLDVPLTVQVGIGPDWDAAAH
ncbi:DNA polymerase I [Humibacter ginsenosidimutans]|uniref:DNA polymerase I n=1 Tax=Humibacter ginsenosidimutans TaxID=2599293 RepID=A0A5B8M082_9MICO|nr:DNA polymerase I [Humibacter ginsenosidimutans]QDZ13803.1 DNA polymerase I [Humibacter ginsenosidimutans]